MMYQFMTTEFLMEFDYGPFSDLHKTNNYYLMITMNIVLSTIRVIIILR